MRITDECPMIKQFFMLLAASISILTNLSAANTNILPAQSFWQSTIPVDTHPPPAQLTPGLQSVHPRLIFRDPATPGPGRTFAEVRRLWRDDHTFQTIFAKALTIVPDKQEPVANAACWIVTGDDKYAAAAINTMQSKVLSRSGEPYYSELWSYALAYDWLFAHPLMTPKIREDIETKIMARLKTELDDLDGLEMALWHGRNQAANGVMIAALAVGDLPEQNQTLRRATAHYLVSLRALQLTGGWPEGASYWIYNRAGPYARAADCVMTATGRDTLDGVDLRAVMQRIGYWSLYQFAPNGVFEPYGDSAGSINLGETGWWELSLDHFARLSRDSGLAAGADYVRNRSPNAYGKRPYYWNIVITYDPTIRPGHDYDPIQPEIWMRGHLPQAMLFGRNSLGTAFFRGAWGDPQELYASFKAGDLLAHHDHYDVGTFTIQRGGELAAHSGYYAEYTAPHRLGYYLQTVAANSILVLAPGETSGYLRTKWPDRASLAGGQRVIRPTGFDCLNLDHFRDQLDAGPHLRRAEILAWRSEPELLDYIAADITAAYNSTRWSEPGQTAKVSRVTRQFLFLRPEEAFVVFDRVDTTDTRFLPKILLHTRRKPLSASETLLKGVATNGIMATTDHLLMIESGEGRLSQHVLLPVQMRALKIGGADYCFYAECDGDQSRGFHGRNLTEGAGRKPGSYGADGWRVEIEPVLPRQDNRFLQVLLPRLATDRRPLPAVQLLKTDTPVIALTVDHTTVIFSRDGLPLQHAAFYTTTKGRCLLLDAQRGGTYSVNGTSVTADQEGILIAEAVPAGEVTLALKPKP